MLGDQATRGIGLLHLALGAATAGLDRLRGSRVEAWVLDRALSAALIVAVDPVLVWQSRFVMTETLTAFLLAAALAALTLPGWRGACWEAACSGWAGSHGPACWRARCLPSLPLFWRLRARGASV